MILCYKYMENFKFIKKKNKKRHFERILMFINTELWIQSDSYPKPKQISHLRGTTTSVYCNVNFMN